MAAVFIAAVAPPVAAFLAWFEARLLRDRGSRTVGFEPMGIGGAEEEEPCPTWSLPE